MRDGDSFSVILAIVLSTAALTAATVFREPKPIVLILTIATVVVWIYAAGGIARRPSIEKKTLKHGLYLVISVACDLVLAQDKGSIDRDVVLVLRRMGNDSRERILHVFSDIQLGSCDSPLRSTLVKNDPKFRFLVEPDGKSATLYQERVDGERLCELKLEF